MYFYIIPNFSGFSDNHIPVTERGNTITTANLGDYLGCSYITSPLYPYDSYSDANVIWSIQASKPENRILVEFVDWKVLIKLRYKTVFKGIFEH